MGTWDARGLQSEITGGEKGNRDLKLCLYWCLGVGSKISYVHFVLANVKHVSENLGVGEKGSPKLSVIWVTQGFLQGTSWVEHLGFFI